MGIYYGGGRYNVVGKEKRPPKPNAIWQHECEGWYIYSNISNEKKAEDLRLISDYYHLELKIEEGKPDSVIQKKTPKINEEAAYWIHPIKIQFQSFLSRTKSESAANSYTSTLDNAVRQWINKVVDTNADSVFSYTTS